MHQRRHPGRDPDERDKIAIERNKRRERGGGACAVRLSSVALIYATRKPQLVVGDVTMLRSGSRERLERGDGHLATVESDGELVQVGAQILLVHPVTGAPPPRSKVAEDAVNPRQDPFRPFSLALRPGRCRSPRARRPPGSPPTAARCPASARASRARPTSHHPGHVWRLLQRTGGAASGRRGAPRSRIPPSRRAGSSPAGPRLKDAARLKAWIVFEDERGFSQRPPIWSTRAP